MWFQESFNENREKKIIAQGTRQKKRVLNLLKRILGIFSFAYKNI